MKKILFPTDFSEKANNAFVYALKWAEKFDAEIITLHVYELPILDMSYVDVPIYQAEVYQSLELNSFQNFKDQIPVLREIASRHKLEHIQISNVLLSGDLVSNILQLVESEHIHFVIMGTSRVSGFKEMFLGTNTASVMTGSDACIIGIPDDSTFRPIHKICYTTQFSDEEQDALRKLIPIAKKFNAAIECIFVQTSDNEVKEVVVANWKLLFENEDIKFNTIKSDNVEDSILDFIAANNVDLLAVAKHKRGFWDSLFHASLTKKLAMHIHIPLLVLHDH
ncbi:universal stress protein [Flavobacterium antarcticum]|uniref:universal stress protein n=1 Tax=Flavobacterium antarcticum TaxID=271155 RepID=UPI0003B59B58|nr:universal stress protein [Flavobacterium antarcticum]